MQKQKKYYLISKNKEWSLGGDIESEKILGEYFSCDEAYEKLKEEFYKVLEKTKIYVYEDRLKDIEFYDNDENGYYEVYFENNFNSDKNEKNLIWKYYLDKCCQEANISYTVFNSNVSLTWRIITN